MRILIAGCGDLGRRLAALQSDLTDCVGLSRRVLPPLGNLRFIQADVTERDSLAVLKRESFDALIYTATPEARTEAAYRRIYLDGFANVVDALSHQPKRIVFVSSTAVYGNHDGAWIDELTPASPTEFNGEILLAAEHAARRLCPEVILVRFGGLYQSEHNRLLDAMVTRMQERQGDPEGLEVFTNRMHRDDAARVLDLLLHHPKPPLLLNGVDLEPATRGDIANWVRQELFGPSGFGVAVGHGLDEQPGAQTASMTPTQSTLMRNKVEPNRRIAATVLKQLNFTWHHPNFRSGFSPWLNEKRRALIAKD